MVKSEFYCLVGECEPASNVRLNSDGTPLSADKQRHLNRVVAEVRALRSVYGNDPLIREVTTNILAGLILVDGE